MAKYTFYNGYDNGFPGVPDPDPENKPNFYIPNMLLFGFKFGAYYNPWILGD